MIKLIEVLIGNVKFTAERRGPHYLVTVRGHGPDGHRPLLGTCAMLPAEWDDLVKAAERLGEIE